MGQTRGKCHIGPSPFGLKSRLGRWLRGSFGSITSPNHTAIMISLTEDYVDISYVVRSCLQIVKLPFDLYRVPVRSPISVH